MEVLEVVPFIVGAALVLYTIRAAIRLFLVPRALQLYLAHFVFLMVRRVFWPDRHYLPPALPWLTEQLAR